jgi:hypothetical protein
MNHGVIKVKSVEHDMEHNCTTRGIVLNTERKIREIVGEIKDELA